MRDEKVWFVTHQSVGGTAGEVIAKGIPERG